MVKGGTVMEKSELFMIKDMAKILTKQPFFSMPSFVGVLSSQLGIYGSTDTLIDVESVGDKNDMFYRLKFKIGHMEKFSYFSTGENIIAALIGFSNYQSTLDNERMKKALSETPGYLDIVYNNFDSLDNIRVAKQVLLTLAYRIVQESLVLLESGRDK